MTTYRKSNINQVEPEGWMGWELTAYLFETIGKNMDHYKEKAIELGILDLERDAWIEYVRVNNKFGIFQNKAGELITGFEAYCRQKSISRRRIVFVVETEDETDQERFENYINYELNYTLVETKVGVIAYKDL